MGMMAMLSVLENAKKDREKKITRNRKRVKLEEVQNQIIDLVEEELTSSKSIKSKKL